MKTGNPRCRFLAFAAAESPWLSDARIDGWIDERAALLAPYMDEDYRLVPPLGHDGDYAAAVETLRGEAHASAAWLDDLLSR